MLAGTIPIRRDRFVGVPKPPDRVQLLARAESIQLLRDMSCDFAGMIRPLIALACRGSLARRGWRRKGAAPANQEPRHRQQGQGPNSACPSTSAQHLWGMLGRRERLAHGCAFTKYTSRTDQVAFRRNFGFTRRPILTSARSTPTRRERKSVFTPSNSSSTSVKGTSFRNSSAAK